MTVVHEFRMVTWIKKCLPVFTSDVCLLIAGLCELFIGPQPGH